MSRLQIRWPHVLAFVLGALGIWGTAASTALQGGAELSVSTMLLAVSGTTGLLWALFQHTVLPDIEGGTGTSKTMLGGSGRPPPRALRTSLVLGRSPGAWPAGVLVGVCTAIVVLWGLALTTSGCSQLRAAFPVLDQVEKIVLSDLEAGKGLEAIEIDVASAVAGKTGTAVVVLIDDALVFLEDMGVIPAQWMPPAKAMHEKASAKIRALGLSR